ncbi:MAG: NAD(P)H-quinone oxidoreductase [Myxococcales bacterium]|nr:NAD(P)H-quinone oxidoreductase [Myxococcales bacterium]
MSDQMFAIHVGDDEARSLSWSVCPRPVAGPQQVLVKIHATALNRADLLQRKGFYPPPKGASEIMGLEAAGEIVACGEGVTSWHEGDAVCVLLEGGGYAEYVVCDASMLLPKPANLSWEEAAALPEVFYTAYLNLAIEGALQPKERVLLHAAASGVGTAVLQLCRHWGNPVWATASASKLPTLLEMGAEEAFDRKQEDLFGVIREKMKQQGDAPVGFDLIFDPVGGAYFAENVASLRPKGRLVLIGLMGGRKAEIALDQILMRRLRIVGSVLRSRSRSEKVVITEGLRRDVWPLFEQGILYPVVDRVFSIRDAEEAQRYLGQDQSVGKVILRVDGP